MSITDNQQSLVSPGGAENKIPKKILRHFYKAVKQACKSDVKKSNHGAIILDKNNNLIGEGYNYYNKVYNNIKNYGYEVHGSWTIHAEIMAIYDVHKKGYNCKKILPKCSILVIRIPNYNINPNEIGIEDCNNSYPCSECKSILEKWGINRIYTS